MYSPVFLSWPTASGSPPVLSISSSDHSFSVLASSFACTLAHSRPLWRFMFFSKPAFNALSSSSRCSGDNSFLLLLVFFIRSSFIVGVHAPAARVQRIVIPRSEFTPKYFRETKELEPFARRHWRASPKRELLRVHFF